jgi:histidinol-phosphate/aromatic aminotransferase/cobyric acid decarboxylase-like protein
MSSSRRAFLGGGSGASSFLVALVAARGLEAATATCEGGALPVIPPSAADEVKINTNESPVGSGKRTQDTLLAEIDQSKRYPFNSRVGVRELLATLTERCDGRPENFVLGAGLTEILRNGVRISCGPDRHVVTALPSYSSPVVAG